MGNEIGKSASRLGVCAMAFTTTNIEKDELATLMSRMIEIRLSTKQNNQDMTSAPLDINSLSRTQFDDSLKIISKFDASDLELLQALFTMFDNSGEGLVNYKEYLSGVAGCLISGSAAEKLDLAFTLYTIDSETPGQVTRGDGKKVLNSICNVASYFGDPVVSPENIESVILEVFKPITSPAADKQTIVNAIMNHNITEIFLSGKGSVRFGR